MSFGNNEIIKCLEQFKPTIFKHCKDSCILSVSMLPKSSEPLISDTIYVAVTPAELSEFSQLENLHIVACFQLESVPFDVNELCSKRSLDLVFLALPPEPEDILARLSTALKESHKISQFSRELLELLSHDGTVQKMVDLAYKYLENPIVVIDAGLRLIATKWDNPNMDEHTERIFRNGYLDMEDIKMMNYDNIHAKVKKSPGPVLVQNKNYKGDRIITMLSTKIDIGQVAVVEIERPFRNIDYTLAEVLRDSIVQQMKKDEFIQSTKGFNYEYFLKDLLDGKYEMKTGINKRLANLDKQFSEPIYCIVIEINRTPGAISITHIRSGFEALFNGISTIVYDGQIVAVISERNKAKITTEEVSIIEEYCEANDLYCGMSNAFNSITLLPKFYNQALTAIKVGADGKRTSGLFIYKKHFMKHVANVFLQKESAETFCCPQMSKLIEYDTAKGQDLAKTLYMYLLYGEYGLAASALFVHRNTVIYRMEVINTIVSIDYEDPQLRQYLIMSYEFMSSNMLRGQEHNSV